ncbi:MAG: hypothetical protein ACHQM6_11250, partial [Candidatus Kapaibacterium sp.]
NSGNGLYYFVPGSAGVSQSPTLNFALSITPNPSIGKGEIRFTLSERNMIRITIFDILGNEIILLFKEYSMKANIRVHSIFPRFHQAHTIAERNLWGEWRR